MAPPPLFVFVAGLLLIFDFFLCGLCNTSEALLLSLLSLLVSLPPSLHLLICFFPVVERHLHRLRCSVAFVFFGTSIPKGILTFAAFFFVFFSMVYGTTASTTGALMSHFGHPCWSSGCWLRFLVYIANLKCSLAVGAKRAKAWWEVRIRGVIPSASHSNL